MFLLHHLKEFTLSIQKKHKISEIQYSEQNLWPFKGPQVHTHTHTHTNRASVQSFLLVPGPR